MYWPAYAGWQTYAFGSDYNGNVTGITMPSEAVHQLAYTVIDQPELYAARNAPYLRSYDKDGA